MATSAYIHIPFCKSKCKYCSFISYPDFQKKEQYLKTLENEIRYFYQKEPLKTLYFGGGTPSTLNINEFERLINLFDFEKNPEITVELNPENITFEYLQNLKRLGINRLSIGCQTFDDRILQTIGRRHNAKDVKNAVENAQKADFKNISLDFIYGLPNQTIDGFSHDLITAKSLNIQHISLYGLKIDENCYFHRCPPENLPDDDTQADMYITAIEALKDFVNKNIYIESNISKIQKAVADCKDFVLRKAPFVVAAKWRDLPAIYGYFFAIRFHGLANRRAVAVFLRL